jgi:DNA-binding LacI/PurR family transcriptional regulator
MDHLHPRVSDIEFVRALAKSFLGVERVPTAFVALNDEIAIGANRGFQEAGIRVPEDVSVTGFKNQDSLMANPNLTSVDQQIENTVEAAADILIARIGHPIPKRAVVRTIQPLLVVRESTGRARSVSALRARPV